MGAAIIVDPSELGNSGTGTLRGLTVRQRCELVRAQAELERTSFIPHWQQLNDFILPRRARFSVTDTNKGDRRSKNVYDSTATTAARTLSAGLMSHVTSPANPWFELETPYDELNAVPTVKEWCFNVTKLLLSSFEQSNLYDELPSMYGDCGVFGTSVMAMVEDDEDLFRFYVFPIGTYALMNDAKQRTRTFTRTFRLTVGQIVERWGQIDPKTGKPNFLDGRPSPISITVQNLWRRGTYGAWIDLAWIVMPNWAYDGEKIDAKYKRYVSIYYELGSTGQPFGDANTLGVLEHSGFDEFPILTARWDANAEDVYATNCPGMTALPDVKELQVRTKRTAQAEEKMLNPPMVGPSSMKNAKASILPGDITYLDIQGQQQGFKPAHEINFGASFAPMEAKSQAIRDRINRAFYADLFLMLENLDRRDITATEISERKEEKLLALGPMLQRLNQGVFDPLVDRAFAIHVRRGKIPPAPQEMQGVPLRVRYVSVMAQAQKRVGLASLERFASFVAQTAQADPSVTDVVNGDELVRRYSDDIDVPPKIVRSDEEVQQLRQQRAQQQAQAQAAENAPKIAGAVQSLSQSPTTGSTVLADLVAKTRAKSTLGATQSPPPGVVS